MKIITLRICIYILFIQNVIGQSNEPIQDPSLNNLVLPENYKTGILGELGAVKKIGKGKQTIILIPGWGFGADVYDNFIQENKHKYTIYNVTLAGFGGTAPPPMPDSATYDKQLWINGAVNGILELINKEKLVKPIIISHFNIGTQVALNLALDHSDQISKVVLLSGIPYRYYRPFSDTTWGKEARFTTAERTKIVNQYWAPTWYKTVTKKTWDAGNHTPEEYSKDYNIGKKLFDKSAQVPMPVMIQYLLEFFTYDPSARYDEIKIPVLVLLPSFSEPFFNENYQSINQTASREWMKYYYLGVWDSAKEVNNSMMEIKTIPNSHLFIWYDNPKDTYKEINKFIKKS